ncbi:hypothetical protein AAFF_G00014210 [Aldrovandia affinis]|uniref:NXPE C-terminal domain-containing protein n=1 Tax=Aldrovandia affinis TaxID=143900 RepID=A0AAD7WH59_9TELE|nr:hypothetical protein AAFF_G00014210 [Aldrovandia affinis]
MYSKKLPFILLCFSIFLFMFFSKIYKQTYVMKSFKTPHKEMTVDGVMSSVWGDLPTTTNFTSLQKSSSARWSVARLEHPKAQYCVGDILSVQVEMRDYEGSPKAQGGDFILARIHSPKLHASASGAITDLLNGSYGVHFRLFWPGEVCVSVLLIHSSEAVSVLTRISKQNYGKIVYTGTFARGSKVETSVCGLRLKTDKALCEYRKKEDGEYYACVRPQTLPCSSLKTMRSYNSPSPYLTQDEGRLLAWWTSSLCQTGRFLSAGAINRCLQGKRLHLLGDSTVRQWIECLEKKLEGLTYVEPVDHFSTKLAVDSHRNITVQWKKHSLPFISAHNINVNNCVYISRELDRIEVGEGQPDVVVVIGVGQHFRPFPPELFIQRLINMRQAIVRLQSRSPQALVIIKLENTRELSSVMTIQSDWYGHVQNLAQRKVFEDLKVVLVDAWDMSVAANTFATHPENIVVSNEIVVALSHLCHYP